MKRFFITIIFTLILFVNAVYAAGNSDILGHLENSVFGYDYKNDSDTIRIERLEKHIYGAAKKGNFNTRIENITNDIGFSIPKDKPAGIPDKNNHIAQQPEKQKNANLPMLKEDSSVEYPMVDKIEKEVFNTTYKNENIYARLNRLEEKVFNKTSNEDLNTRVDKLASVVVPKKRKTNYNQDMFSSNNLDSYYANSGLEPVNDQSLPFQLAALEEDILRSSYMHDNNANRLNRLEQKLFNRSFPNDADITRLQRIMVAYDAKKNSYKYENNRKMQNMATVSQIGGILLMILAILL